MTKRAVREEERTPLSPRHTLSPPLSARPRKLCCPNCEYRGFVCFIWGRKGTKNNGDGGRDGCTRSRNRLLPITDPFEVRSFWGRRKKTAYRVWGSKPTNQPTKFLQFGGRLTFIHPCPTNRASSPASDAPSYRFYLRVNQRRILNLP